ncbi:MAG: KOW domain-containing protein [Peptostreptococcaceae bacterium]
MLSNNLSVGQVVRSTSGREKERLFFVVKVIDSNYVLIADGKKRKLGKPKLKKVKHLEICNVINEEIKNKILSQKDTVDAFLRAQLTKLNQSI